MSERESFWLVIVTPRGGFPQVQVTPNPDNRKTARELAAKYRREGHGAWVVQREPWEAP